MAFDLGSPPSRFNRPDGRKLHRQVVLSPAGLHRDLHPFEEKNRLGFHTERKRLAFLAVRFHVAQYCLVLLSCRFNEKTHQVLLRGDHGHGGPDGAEPPGGDHRRDPKMRLFSHPPFHHCDPVLQAYRHRLGLVGRCGILDRDCHVEKHARPDRHGQRHHFHMGENPRRKGQGGTKNRHSVHPHEPVPAEGVRRRREHDLRVRLHRGTLHLLDAAAHEIPYVTDQAVHCIRLHCHIHRAARSYPALVEPRVRGLFPGRHRPADGPRPHADRTDGDLAGCL